MTTIHVQVSNTTVRFIISGGLIRGEGAMGAIQRDLRRAAIANFDTLIVDLEYVTEIDDDGAAAIKVAMYATRSLEANFRLEHAPAHAASVLARHGLAGPMAEHQ